MTFFRKVPRFILQDWKLRRKVVMIVLGLIPVLYVLGVLFSGFFNGVSTIQQFVLLLRFEFTYCPLFVLMISVTRDLDTSVLVRRFERRDELALYQTVSVAWDALIFTLVVLVFGICTYLFHFHRKLTGDFSLVAFTARFWLVLVSTGLLFIVLERWINRVLSALAVISLVIVDRFTLKAIPLILEVGDHQRPFMNLLMLFLVIVVLLSVIMNQINRRDFYHGDDSH
ncbi:hypothetical protein JI721_06855 [Alicyclobacillus cycloheptanicus]|uniref:Magnesium-transporting ATPase (P-type) n=1 Tax=Alicyclobacillus cycloheptanicus TaxID=1457 RepID=A0ABT9XJD1_9BACL|nr:hypothetical protein [Alicyclobacillus cycloheptanicus]MDQ0189826.1 magnesium-transporting ATPase (P-type) [Alicyclobacillus cycloheptanicus]WDM02488.1 hypothetical protein JI721_06855 [Alicyclobacillus cycloheptanicus]